MAWKHWCAKLGCRGLNSILYFHVVHQQHWGSSAEKRKGGWFRSVTPQIMWYHGSGCATMATVFHWPTDGLPSVSVWYLLNGGLGGQRASSAILWMMWGETDRGNKRYSDEPRPAFSECTTLLGCVLIGIVGDELSACKILANISISHAAFSPQNLIIQ